MRCGNSSQTHDPRETEMITTRFLVTVAFVPSIAQITALPISSLLTQASVPQQ
ncbi:MAG: hypothetical protein H6R02_1669 [Burkholderiaceae bacterium]|jgi:hypothetical protein|nr:hypothetical protein [Burkholderiaceae bacterium]